MNDTPTAERMIAILVPSFSILAAGGELDEPAVTAAVGRVQVTTAPAREAGVRRGQRVRDAERACPGLRVLSADPGRDGRAFEPVIAALEQAAVGVEAVRPGLCVLRAAGPVRFYGGEAAAAKMLRDAIAEVELEQGGEVAAGVGIANGSVAAALAARTDTVVPAEHTAAFLGGFGLDVLGRPQLTAVLQQLGIRTLGELAALPAAAVTGRFGAEGLAAHRLARGLATRPPAPRIPAADLAESLEFDPAQQLVEPLVFAAKMLADRVHERLTRSGLVCDRIEIAARTRDGWASKRWWRHDGQLSSRAVAERARWQLSAAWPSGVGGEDPDDGFIRLDLRPDGLRVATGRQLTLLGPEPLPDLVDDAVERLQALLGYHAVTRPVLLGGRDPGDRIALVPVGDLEPDTAGDGPWPGRIPEPAPAVVPAQPTGCDLLDAAGARVRVSARGDLSASPAWLALGGERFAVASCSTAWIAHEHPWMPGGGRRRARLQLVLADERAFLAALEDGAWCVLAAYQ